MFFVIGEAADVDTIFRQKKEEDKKKNEVSTSYTHRNSLLLVQVMNLNRLVNNMTKSYFDPLGEHFNKSTAEQIVCLYMCKILIDVFSTQRSIYLIFFLGYSCRGTSYMN